MTEFWKYVIWIAILIPLISAWGSHHHNKQKKKHFEDCPYENEETHECCYTKSVNRTLPVPFFVKCHLLPTTTPGTTTPNKVIHSIDSIYPDDCLVLIMVTLNVTYGIKGCCDGWKEDYYGDCTIKSDESTEISCLNGGNITTDGKSCVCPEGFAGDSCEEAICNPPCMNQGECAAEEGKPVCLCYGGRFTGKQCETPVCPETCLNGGECKQFGITAECLCRPLWEGPKCQYRKKSGQCPVPDADSLSCYTECNYDSDCKDNEQCCSTGCGMSCRKSVANECHYKGNVYKIGQSFKDGICKSCTCLHPGYQGVQCTKQSCPVFNCTHALMSPDECCPVCKDHGEPMGTGPKFKQCKNVILYVQPNSEKADLHLSPSLQIKAVDSNNVEYKTHFSAQYLSSCGCSDTRENQHHVVATSESDKYGRFDTCTFIAEVKDPYPPSFLSCPSPKQVLFNEKVIWNEPEVVDNVGVESLTLLTPHVNNTLFGIGEYVVVYIAKDFDGNEAVCRFLVEVYHPSSKYLPPSLLARRYKGNDYTVIAMLVGIIGGLTILVTAVSYALRRCQHIARPSESITDASETNVPPPAYDAIEKDSLPQYSAVAPPVYEQIDAVAMTTTKNGVENPIYTVTEENDDVMETKVPIEDNLGK